MIVNVYDDILCHHGIKGQRWGVRRYQEEDGSLTAAGKERYSSSTGSSNYMLFDFPGRTKQSSNSLTDAKKSDIDKKKHDFEAAKEESKVHGLRATKTGQEYDSIEQFVDSDGNEIVRDRWGDEVYAIKAKDPNTGKQRYYIRVTVGEYQYGKYVDDPKPYTNIGHFGTVSEMMKKRGGFKPFHGNNLVFKNDKTSGRFQK